MPASPISQLVIFLILGGCLFALWKGQRPERISAILILANVATTFLEPPAIPFELPAWAQLAVDGITALGLLAVTLMYGRVWLGVAMLLFAAQFALHSFYYVTERPSDLTHAYINNGNIIGITLCLLIGTIAAWRARAAARRSASA